MDKTMLEILYDYKEDRQLSFFEDYLLMDVNLGAIADTLEYQGIEHDVLINLLSGYYPQWAVVYDGNFYHLVNLYI